MTKEFEELKALCQKVGFRLTHQRLEIYKEIKQAKDHPSVETIYERLKKRIPTISLDTVYRTLTMFEELGVIRKVYTRDPFTRFDPDMSEHHHMICKKCGEIMDFTWPELESIELPRQIEELGKVEMTHCVLIGICNKCSKQGGKR